MIEPRRPQLTMKRLRAMEEALLSRLAGELHEGPEWPSRTDYEGGLAWVQSQISKREARST